LNRIKKDASISENAAEQSNKGEWKVLDLCTGTGCIPLLLLNEWPYSNIPKCSAYGFDIGDEAVLFAQANAESVLSRFSQVPSSKEQNVSVQVMKMDIIGREFENWLASQGKFDIITSNPPYIPDFDWTQLDRSVKSYEDPRALKGGKDGLEFYRRIAQLLSTYRPIRPGGYLTLEFGKAQGSEVKALIEGTKLFDRMELWTDAFGVERTLFSRAL
jgi:release factor glutamine methyltransferase